MDDQPSISGAARPIPRLAGQTAASERTKVSRACDACKSKKTRCTGTRPCVRCSRNNLRCCYNARYSRGRPPTPLPSEHFSSATASPPLTAPTAGNASRTSPEPGTGSEIAGFYFGPTSGLTFLDRAFRRLVSEQGQLPSLHDPATAVGDSIFTVGDRPFPSIRPENGHELPSLEEGLELIRIYFETAIATYRFLHRPTIEQRFRSFWQHRASSQGADPYVWVGPTERATLYFVLAFASFHKDFKFDDSIGIALPTWSASEQYFLAAEAELSRETGRPSLETVQARLVKCIYLLTTARITQAYYCFGNVVQIATTIGMHRKARRVRGGRPENSRDYIQTECTRRVFWSLYIIDKYLGVILGRPRCLHDEDNDQVEPDCVDDQDMTSDGPIGEIGEDCSVHSLIYHARWVPINTQFMPGEKPLTSIGLPRLSA
jgi:hypothetical protein